MPVASATRPRTRIPGRFMGSHRAAWRGIVQLCPRKGAHVALSIQIRRVGEVVVVACRGRLAGASETSELQRAIDQLLPLEPRIVLDGAEMAFVDSAGVGL